MGGDPLKKVQAGDTFNRSAQTFNYMIDAAVAEKRRQLSGGRGYTPIFRQSGIVRVKNNSGSNVGRFGVLGITGPVIAYADDADAYLERVAFAGTTPTNASHLHKFVVTIEPIENGNIGLAVIDGVVPALVNFLPASTGYTAEDWHGYADVSDSNLTRLQSRPFGAAQILSQASGTGEVQTYVRLGVPGGLLWFRGTLNATLTQGGSQAVNLTAPSGEQVTAFDNFLGTGETLASGAKVGITYDPLGNSGAGRYYVTEAVC